MERVCVCVCFFTTSFCGHLFNSFSNSVCYWKYLGNFELQWLQNIRVYLGHLLPHSWFPTPFLLELHVIGQRVCVCMCILSYCYRSIWLWACAWLIPSFIFTIAPPYPVSASSFVWRSIPFISLSSLSLQKCFRPLPSWVMRQVVLWCVMSPSCQDLFWNYATSSWKDKDVTADNVHCLASEAATEYVASLSAAKWKS